MEEQLKTEIIFPPDSVFLNIETLLRLIIDKQDILREFLNLELKIHIVTNIPHRTLFLTRMSYATPCWIIKI